MLPFAANACVLAFTAAGNIRLVPKIERARLRTRGILFATTVVNSLGKKSSAWRRRLRLPRP